VHSSDPTHTWDDVHEIRARASAGIEQRDIAAAFKISRPLAARSIAVTSGIRRSSLANGIKPTRAGSGKRVSNRKALAQIDLHWHDLRHEALSRLADDGVPVHELQLLAGHSSITTTQRYMNARASSLAESMRQARERRVKRVEHGDEATAQIG